MHDMWYVKFEKYARMIVFCLITFSLVNLPVMIYAQGDETPGASALNVLEDLPKGHTLKFQHLSAEQGLSSDAVFSIVQDLRGFMWFGTLNGLNRYDGHDYTMYTHDPDDPTSLSANPIRDMIVDRRGRLWVGTGNGLNRFDPDTEHCGIPETTQYPVQKEACHDVIL